jgi:DNA-binding transcriptional LysR family regulator
MELKNLRYFATVAEDLHFGRAARRLHIAQPALSQQIQKLENELGVRLLDRSKRHVRLTQAGSAFLTEAREILARVDRAAQAAQLAGRSETGSLVVACGPICSYAVLPAVLEKYRHRFPKVNVTVKSSHMTEIVRGLEDGTADVGLLVPYFHSKTLQREIILKIPLIAALPKSHPLAAARQISLKELAGDAFVLFPDHHGSGFREHVLGLCQKAGFTPKAIQEVSQFNILTATVGAGYGVSLVPAFPHEKSCFSSIELKERYASVEVCMAWKAKDSSSLVSGFLETVRAIRRTQAE